MGIETGVIGSPPPPWLNGAFGHLNLLLLNRITLFFLSCGLPAAAALATVEQIK